LGAGRGRRGKNRLVEQKTNRSFAGGIKAAIVPLAGGSVTALKTQGDFRSVKVSAGFTLLCAVKSCGKNEEKIYLFIFRPKLNDFFLTIQCEAFHGKVFADDFILDALFYQKMKLKKFSILSVLVLALGFCQTNASPIVYTFVPGDGWDGFGGSITLDSAANSSGGVVDVLAINIFGPISGPTIDTYTFDPSTEFLTLNSPGFSWNSSTITQMNIGVTQNVTDYFLFAVYDDGLLGPGMDVAAAGSWVATRSDVPDAANTWLLLGLALTVLAAFHHRPTLLPVIIRR
jgi:hypothetical protein